LNSPPARSTSPSLTRFNPDHGLAASWRSVLEGSIAQFFTGNAFIEHVLGTSNLMPNNPFVLKNGEIPIS
jgi:hypothetical protein